MKTCTKDNCDRKHVARGLCGSHYNQEHQPNRHAKKLVACAWCEKPLLRGSGGGRKHGAACSEQCRGWLRFGFSVLPEDHWARWYGKSSEWVAPAVKDERPAFIGNQCDECGIRFIEANHGQPSVRCSKRCTRRVMRRGRKAREHDSPGSFRWVEVIRIWVAGGKLCSYCDVVMTEQPDPDHVVPISRGGRNDLGNIVPCCRLCNSDKCDMTLDEWASERAKQGKPPLRYALAFSNPRFKHLTIGEAKGFAWRHGMGLAA